MGDISNGIVFIIAEIVARTSSETENDLDKELQSETLPYICIPIYISMFKLTDNYGLPVHMERV